MTNPFLGLYRTVSGAYVASATMAFQVPEPDYRAYGYQPDYDDLPWKEDYEAQRLGAEKLGQFPLQAP